LPADAVRAARRAANIHIAENARGLDFSALIPFVCECRDAGCRGFARMPLDAYDVIATQRDWSILGDAHGFRAIVVDTLLDRTVLEMALEAA
jgi:hypothetical protein